jgi:hypothetical protein
VGSLYVVSQTQGEAAKHCVYRGKNRDGTWVELEDLPEGIWASGHIDSVLGFAANDRTQRCRRDGVQALGTVERQCWTGGVIARQGKAIRLYSYENEDLGLGRGSGS